MKNFTPFSEFKKELLSDPEVKRAYDEMAPEYALIQSIIDKRLSKKMSQKQLAQKMGTHQSAISRIESGEANPSFKSLKKIATALNAKLVISFK